MTERLDEVKAEIDEAAKLTGSGFESFVGRQARLSLFGMLLELGPQHGLLSEEETAQARKYLLKLRDVVSARAAKRSERR
jgi:hypothetical protein